LCEAGWLWNYIRGFEGFLRLVKTQALRIFHQKNPKGKSVRLHIKRVDFLLECLRQADGFEAGSPIEG